MFAEDSMHLFQPPLRHAVPIGCEQSAPGVLNVAWIVQAARYTVLLPSCSRTISWPQPCTCIIIGMRVNGGGDLPGAACCIPRRSKRGRGHGGEEGAEFVSNSAHCPSASVRLPAAHLPAWMAPQAGLRPSVTCILHWVWPH